MSCRKNLHNHPFTWNKQYIFKPARSSRKHVSSYLSPSVHLVLYYFRAMHVRPSAVQDASGECGFENAICSHTITSTLAAVHARSCLFIRTWRRLLMLIDFIMAETWALHSRLSAHQRDLTWASPPGRCGCYHVSRRHDSAIVNNRLWRKYTDHSTDCIAHAAEHVTGLCI